MPDLCDEFERMKDIIIRREKESDEQECERVRFCDGKRRLNHWQNIFVRAQIENNDEKKIDILTV